MHFWKMHQTSQSPKIGLYNTSLVAGYRLDFSEPSPWCAIAGTNDIDPTDTHPSDFMHVHSESGQNCLKSWLFSLELVICLKLMSYTNAQLIPEYDWGFESVSFLATGYLVLEKESEKFPGITPLFKVEHMHVFNRVDIFKLRITLPVKRAFSFFPSLNTLETFLFTAGLSSISFSSLQREVRYLVPYKFYTV